MPLHLNEPANVVYNSAVILDGVTQASMAFWIRRVNGTAPAGFIYIFGNGSGDGMSIGYETNGNIFFWVNSGNSSISKALNVGTDYHCAMTFDNGEHKLFLNGVLTNTQDFGGTSISSGGSPVQFGETFAPENMAGIDLLLDEAAIWDDHILTPLEIKALRDRTSTPDQIGPTGPENYWTLDGTNGADVTASDPGILDQGNSGLTVNSIHSTPPTWSTEAMEFSAPARVRTARVSNSGKMIYLEFEQTSDLADTLVQSIAALPEPYAAATVDPTGGGAAGGSLPAGNYYLKYTYSSSFGETTEGASLVGPFTVAAGNIPRATFPHLPSGASINVYLSDTDGLASTASLYASNVNGTTADLTAGTWENDAQSPPGANGTDSILPTIEIDGGAAISLEYPAWQTNGTWESLLFPIPTGTTVTAGQSVVLNALVEFVGTAAGLVEAAVDIAVTNGVGSLLEPLVSDPRTMAVGYNINVDTYAAPSLYHSSLYAGSWPMDHATANFNAKGYPVDAPSTYLIRTLEIGYPDPPGGLYQNIIEGNYTMLWRDPGATGSVPTLTPWSGETTISEVSSDLSGDVKRKVFNVTSTQFYGSMQGNVPVGIEDLKLYPPGVDPDNPSLAYPGTLSMLEGVTMIRFMDWNKINDSNVSLAADLLDPDALWMERRIGRRIAIDQAGPYANGDNAFTGGGAMVEFRSTSPHGLVDGQTVTIVTDPTNIDLVTGGTTNFWNFGALAHVTGTDTFAFQWWQTDSVDGVQAISSEVELLIQPGPHPNNAIEFCRLSETDPWICVPHLMTDAAIQSLAQLYLAAMPAGMKLRVQLSNETWNDQFKQTGWLKMRTRISGMENGDGEGHMRYYAKRASEAHKIFFDEFDAAGRGSDIIRVFGSWFFTPNTTQVLVDYCNDPATYGVTPTWWSSGAIPMDEIAIAPYLWAGPNADVLTAVYDGLDVEQLCDIFDLTMLKDGDFAKVGSHKTIIDTDYPTAKLTCYEGTPEIMAPNSMTNHARYSRAVSRHPRAYGIMTKYLDRLQEMGCSSYADYKLAGVYFNYLGGEGNIGDAVWPKYSAINQDSGLGDGSDGKFDNRTFDPGVDEHQDEVVSVMGQAIKDWLAASPASGVGTGARFGRRRRAAFRRSV